MEAETQCYCGRGNPLTKEVPFLEEAVLGRKTNDVYYMMLTGFFGAEAAPDELLREPTGEDIYYFLPAQHPLSHSTNRSSFFLGTTLFLLSAHVLG